MDAKIVSTFIELVSSELYILQSCLIGNSSSLRMLEDRECNHLGQHSASILIQMVDTPASAELGHFLQC